jgi:hypothetical protein
MYFMIFLVRSKAINIELNVIMLTPIISSLRSGLMVILKLSITMKIYRIISSRMATLKYK